MYPKSFFQNSRSAAQNGTCFILMPFAPRFDEVYAAIVDAIEGPALNFLCKRADDVFGGGHIIEDILRGIAESEVIVADVTSKNSNVFYELGIAHMVKDVEKVIIITQEMDDIPFDLRQLRCIVYEQSEQGIRRLKSQLTSAVEQVSEPAFRFTVKMGKPFIFQKHLMGEARYLYSFEIPELFVGSGSAKFLIRILRHALREPDQEVSMNPCGILCGEEIPFRAIPWKLKLVKVTEDTAFFSLLRNENADMSVSLPPPPLEIQVIP
jgi:hypothetical protein